MACNFDSSLNDVSGGPLVFGIRRLPGGPLVTSFYTLYKNVNCDQNAVKEVRNQTENIGGLFGCSNSS